MHKVRHIAQLHPDVRPHRWVILRERALRRLAPGNGGRASPLDMGVSHAGLVKLCRFLNMNPRKQNTHAPYVKHTRLLWRGC